MAQTTGSGATESGTFHQALSTRWDISRLKMGYEAFRVVSPAAVDVLLDAWIVHLLPEQVE